MSTVTLLHFGEVDKCIYHSFSCETVLLLLFHFSVIVWCSSFGLLIAFLHLGPDILEHSSMTEFEYQPFDRVTSAQLYRKKYLFEL